MTAGDRASPRLVVSPRAETREAAARAWLARQERTRDLLVIGPDDATADLVRAFAREHGALLGCARTSLGRLAATLAAAALAERGLTAASPLAMEALSTRVVESAAGAGTLGRFARVGRTPGLPRALARTAHELAMAGVSARELADVDPDLAALLAALADERARARVADRSAVFALAAASVRAHAPTLFFDVRVEGVADAALVAALARGAQDVLATVPRGDETSLARFSAALGVPPTALSLVASSRLARAQDRLFGDASPGGDAGEDVTILSAPGESRECVELARVLLAEAARGVPFDRMAVLLRAPETYRAHLVEALRRARIPAYFAEGARLPDPSGRALLALLACAGEGISARRFAEYLSLGEVPAGDDGAPPTPAADDAPVALSEDELSPPSLALGAENDDASTPSASPAPRRWERLIVDAAVIGGHDRWARRFACHRAALTRERAAEDEPDGPRAAVLARDLAHLDALERFALPLVDALFALPALAPWGTWLEALAALATRALRRPARVHAVLAELAPMASVGPVGLAEVRLALAQRLTDLPVAPPARRYGRVYVAAASNARGLSFELVLVPGMVERGFPRKLPEDPLLSDATRARLERGLPQREERVETERLALRLAVGAARRRLVVSFPRVDAADGRPRTPSFYGLEILRAAEGRLPGFDELSRRAERGGSARLGWPAPMDKADAIDDAEHDLALLADVLGRPPEATRGAARYLVTANPHLARSLRARHARWKPAWTSADGIWKPGASVAAELTRHALAAHAYAPTTLEAFAACPFRFYLRAIVRLAPREEPLALEELGARRRGIIVHEILHALGLGLAAASLLPVRSETLEQAWLVLDAAWADVVAAQAEALAPAIARTWDDAMDAIRADLRAWLRLRASAPPSTAIAFELPFVADVAGMKLRGVIDAVERRDDGALVAVDYKTGKAVAHGGTVIGGGRVLQPVLYALALEARYPSERVAGARLAYCTSAGDFREVDLPLDAAAREGARAFAETVERALAAGQLPAAPAEGACQACDYAIVCGPAAASRAARKPGFTSLEALRRHA